MNIKSLRMPFQVPSILQIMCAITIAVIGGAGAYGSASAATRAATPAATQSNIAYGVDSSLQVLDYYAPAGGVVSPVVVVVHGGGWTKGDKLDPNTSSSAQKLSADGFAVFNINYRLATSTVVGNPMENNDIKAAVRWVQQNGANYFADTTHINLLGGSAGGHLVGQVGQQMNAELPGTIHAVASLSGPMDFSTFSAQSDTTVKGGVNSYLGCKLTLCDPAYVQQSSPVYNINSATCPPFFLANSLDETAVPKQQAQEMNDALVAAGCRSTLDILPGTLHAFNYFDTVRSALRQFFLAP